MRILRHLARHIIANHRIQTGNQHERLAEEGGDALLIGLDAHHQVALKGAHPVREQAHAVQQVADEERLEDVEFELAGEAADGGGHVVAHDLGGEHGEGFALGGVDFARHDGGAGFVFGELELAEAAAGAGAEVADVLGDFEEGAGERVEGAAGFDDGVVGGEEFEFVGRGVEGGVGELADFFGDAFGEADEGVEAGADCGAALGELAEMGKTAVEPLEVAVELGDVAAEFLAEGQWSGVLKVGSADFDDAFEGVGFGFEGVAEGLEGWDEVALNLKDGSNVHDGWEGVVGRGRHVDVVIGMDRLLRTHCSSEDLDGAIGDDFVGIHVGLCA